MTKHFITLIAAVGIIVTSQSTVLAANRACLEKDAVCKEFAALSDSGQFDRIIHKVDTKASYSDEAKALIGQAYLSIAGQETNTPAQEEFFCLKALEYGATSAYMGLYFINADKDLGKALTYLRQYIMTDPQDSVPYVILGEFEMGKENYEDANLYLRHAKSVARGSSSNLDWALFQVNYMIGDFAYASAMLDSVVSRGQFVAELKNLSADPCYADIGIRPEFSKYAPLIKGTSAMAIN